MTREMQSSIYMYFTSSSDVTSIAKIVRLDFPVSLFFSLLGISLSFSLYLILSKAKLSSAKVRGKRRPCVKNDYYDEAFRGHERTNATPRRWGVAVVAVWLARLTITPFHPCSRAPRTPSTSRFSLTLQRPLSLVTPVCAYLFLLLCRSISESTNIYFLSFSFLSYILSFPCIMHFSSSSLKIFSASLPFSLFPSFFLSTLSLYLPLFTSISLFLFVVLSHFSLLALSRASPSVPQQPSRHWPGGRSREHRLGQSCAEWRHPRRFSHRSGKKSRA